MSSVCKASRSLPLAVYAHPDALPRLKRDGDFLKMRADFFEKLYEEMGCGEAGRKQAAYLREAIIRNQNQSIQAEVTPVRENHHGFSVIYTPGHAQDHIVLYHPEFELHPWQVWLIYVAWTLIAFVVNAFMNSLLPYINRTAFIWSIGGFAIICITVLTCASPDYASAEFVFTEFINETGWPDGIAWLLGLLQGGFGLTGYDAVAHMIEEIPNASIEGPKIMIYCVCIGTVTGFIFLMVLLFVSGGDAASIISAAPGPLLQILYNATKSRAGATCLLMFPLVCILFAETAIMTTSSRMTYAFARDGGLPFSKFFAKVHPRLGQPLNALILAATLTILFGLILIGSSSAFNALISASVVALGVSYAIPVAINLCRGRKSLGPRAFALSEPLGWAANILGVAYTIITTVLFLFPPELPVTPSNMSKLLFRYA